MSKFPYLGLMLGLAGAVHAAPVPSEVQLPLTPSTAVTGDASLTPAPEPGAVLWQLPEGTDSAALHFDLPKLGLRPRDFNEIHIRFKPLGGEVQWEPELTAYPVKGMRRHWYSKQPLRQNQWQTARFDLDLDDDGWWAVGDTDLEHSAFNLVLRKIWEHVPGEGKTRAVELGGVELVRRAVSVDFDEMAAQPVQSKDVTGWIYQLHVQNHDAVPRTARLWLDVSRTKHFKPDWQRQELKLGPREERIIPVRLTMSRESARQLPPLFSEPVQAFVALPEPGAPEITPLNGYRPRFLWPTLPPPDTKPVLEPLDRAALMRRVDLLLTQDWAVPTHGPATHPQGYYNPATSQTPVPLSWFRHQDPVTKEIFTDDKYVLSYIHRIHTENFDRAKTLADAFRATGDARYAEAARDVLLEYARQYPYMRPSAPSATSGRSRLGLNTLMSTYLFPKACDAYIEIRDSAALGAADRAAIEDGFLRPEARALFLHDVNYTNMQAEHYRAYTRAAFALHYWPMVGEALYGDHGYFAMVEHAFSEDGISLEAGAYHWSTLSAMLEFAKFLDARGINVMTPRFKRVFDGMVADSPRGIYEDERTWPAFDFAYRIYREPRYIPTLKAAKLWPPAYLSPAEVQAATAHETQNLQENSLLPNVGYLWLREQSPRGFRALSLNYISPWDRFEHDKLHFSLFDETGRATAEVGRIIYSAPEVRVMETTLAHNSMVVDGADQTDSPATLAQFLDRPSLPAALFTENSKTPLYPGVQASRVVAILDGVFFVGDLWHAEGEHTFDWPLYTPWQPDAAANIGVPQIGLPLSAGGPATQWLKSLESAHSDAGVSAKFALSGPDPRELNVAFAPMPGAVFANATVPRGYRPKPGPLLLVRQEKRSTATVGAAFSIEAPGVTAVVRQVENLSLTEANGQPVDPGSGAAWKITTQDGVYLVIVNRSGRKLRVAGRETAEHLFVARL